MLIALIVRLVAVFVVLLAIAGWLFVSGRIPFDPEQPGRARHQRIDWGCPHCDHWGTAYISRCWRRRAQRHAVELVHTRLSPTCRARGSDLIIV